MSIFNQNIADFAVFGSTFGNCTVVQSLKSKISCRWTEQGRIRKFEIFFWCDDLNFKYPSCLSCFEIKVHMPCLTTLCQLYLGDVQASIVTDLHKFMHLIATGQNIHHQWHRPSGSKKSLKIPKVQSQSINRRTDNTMAKRN
jgi:hypothetical protein